jgi:hypothetical protein
MHPTGADRYQKPLALQGPSTHGSTAKSSHTTSVQGPSTASGQAGRDDSDVQANMPQNNEFTTPSPSNLDKTSVYSLAENFAKEIGFKPDSDLTELVASLGGKIRSRISQMGFHFLPL